MDTYILQLAFNTILPLLKMIRNSTTTDHQLMYANNLVTPQYQVDINVLFMKYLNHSALRSPYLLCLATLSSSFTSVIFFYTENHLHVAAG